MVSAFAKATVFALMTLSLPSVGAGPLDVDWKTLGSWDYKTGNIPLEVKKLDGQTVHIDGYMIPLEDFQSAVTEFLLLPASIACMHVPTPPPNYIIHVMMPAGVEQKVIGGPVSVEGQLTLVKRQPTSGMSGCYEMTGQSVKRFSPK